MPKIRRQPGHLTAKSSALLQKKLAYALKTQLIFSQSPGQAGMQAALLAFRLRQILRFGAVAVASLDDDQLIGGANDFGCAARQQNAEHKNDFFHGVFKEK